MAHTAHHLTNMEVLCAGRNEREHCSEKGRNTHEFSWGYPTVALVGIECSGWEDSFEVVLVTFGEHFQSSPH